MDFSCYSGTVLQDKKINKTLPSLLACLLASCLLAWLIACLLALCLLACLLSCLLACLLASLLLACLLACLLAVWTVLQEKKEKRNLTKVFWPVGSSTIRAFRYLLIQVPEISG